MDKIRFWCHKILPLVYDNSLSYYETLCKFSNKLNELIQFINDLIDEKIIEYIDKRFNDMFINAIYNESEESITLKLEERKHG